MHYIYIYAKQTFSYRSFFAFLPRGFTQLTHINGTEITFNGFLPSFWWCSVAKNSFNMCSKKSNWMRHMKSIILILKCEFSNCLKNLNRLSFWKSPWILYYFTFWTWLLFFFIRWLHEQLSFMNRYAFKSFALWIW